MPLLGQEVRLRKVERLTYDYTVSKWVTRFNVGSLDPKMPPLSSQLAQSFVPVFIKHLLWIDRALPRAEDMEQMAGKHPSAKGAFIPVAERQRKDQAGKHPEWQQPCRQWKEPSVGSGCGCAPMPPATRGPLAQCLPCHICAESG